MSFELLVAAAALCAYLIGSVSFAIVVSRLRGIADPRTYGSGNPGATNVLRSGDRMAAVFTLLGDAAKGAVAVLLARWLLADSLPPDWRLTAESAAALGVFLGHLFPVYHRFQGGKGVATAFGVLIALDPRVGALVGLTWLVVAGVSRTSSLAALSAAVAGPLVVLWWFGLGVMFWSVAAIAVLLVIRHRKNIQLLLEGKEKSFSRRG
jgi:glycerol-3-phosphate acyltransferase PlsY